MNQSFLSFEERFPVWRYDPSVAHEPKPWFLYPHFMRGKINAVLGPEKSGKSRLFNWLLASLFTGNNKLGIDIVESEAPRKHLYLSGEELKEDVASRLRDYIALQQSKVTDLPLDIIEAAGMRLEYSNDRRDLEQLLRTGGYESLIIDPLRRVHGGDENSNTEMAPLFNDFRRWSNQYGVTVMVIHHTGKLNEQADMHRIATWSRGATDFATILDTATFVQELNRGEEGRRLRILRAGRFAPVEPLLVRDMGDLDEGGKGFDLAEEV